jgi:predicted phage terminase large subunit-like protein
MQTSSASKVFSGLPSLAQIQAEIRRREDDRRREDVRKHGDQIRERCKRLAGFVKEAWSVLHPSAPYIHGWHIDAICDHLEAVSDGRITRLLINVPPGTMKSLLVSVFYPAWEWTQKPSLQYLTTSYSEGYVKRDSRRMRDLVQSEWYQSLWGDKVTLARTGEISFENTARGNREGKPFASLTGGRGDRVIIDDPHSTETAESAADRESTTRVFRESVPTRLNDPIRSAIIVIMQRLHEADVSGVALDLGLGYEHLMLPMEFDPERKCVTSIGFEDPRTIEGELLFPERFPAEVVERDKIPLGPYAIAGQFQQTPKPRGGAILKRDYWQVWEDEKYPAFEFVLASADTTYTEKEENDPTGFSIWGVFRGRNDQPRVMLCWSWAKRCELHGQPIEKRAGETKAAYDRRSMPTWGLVEWIAYSCRRFRVDKLLIEAKASGITVAQEMQRLYKEDGWSIQLIKPVGDKVSRVHAVEPSFAAGLVYAPDEDWAEKMIEQAERFPKDKHDDLVDSATQALQYLRQNGLIAHNFEIAAELRDAMEFRPEPKALYDV